MLYTTKRGESFDTDRDLSAPERDILQKLFSWKDMAESLKEFREKTDEALRLGWGDSGPVQESRALKSITQDLEAEVSSRRAPSPTSADPRMSLRGERFPEAISPRPLQETVPLQGILDPAARSSGTQPANDSYSGTLQDPARRWHAHLLRTGSMVSNDGARHKGAQE